MPSISGQVLSNVPTHFSAAAPSAMTQLPLVEAQYLQEALRRQEHPLLVLDCRPATDFLSAHIRGALNVALPSLMLRRLASGKLSLSQVLKHLAPEAADTVQSLYTQVPIVLYDYEHTSQDLSISTLMTALCKKLTQEGCSAHCLKGNFYLITL